MHSFDKLYGTQAMLDVISSKYDIAISGTQMTINAHSETLWLHMDIYYIFTDALKRGVSSILIDKRAHVTPSNTEFSLETAKGIGTLLHRYEAKCAVVLHEKDHFEKIICLKAMQGGGKILSTNDIGEAQTWLNDDIH